MEFLAILGALLAYRVVTDLWDCFGFGCADLCKWLSKLASNCEARRRERHGQHQ